MAQKFRRKSDGVVVEALRWTGRNKKTLSAFTNQEVEFMVRSGVLLYFPGAGSVVVLREEWVIKDGKDFTILNAQTLDHNYRPEKGVSWGELTQGVEPDFDPLVPRRSWCQE